MSTPSSDIHATGVLAANTTAAPAAKRNPPPIEVVPPSVAPLGPAQRRHQDFIVQALVWGIAMVTIIIGAIAFGNAATY